jgi:uncharacterized BrkB/YihY/UPF0761 family membrane protein
MDFFCSGVITLDNKQFYSGIIVGLGIGFIMLAMGIYSVEEMVVIIYKEHLAEKSTLWFEQTFASVLGTVTTALYLFIIGIIVSIAGLILYHHVRPTRQDW